MSTVAGAKKDFPFKTLLSFLGPGFLVTVGFIDPGNWATNIEGGSKFGYELLWVITLSTIMLIVIQHMAAKLGIATGKSLAVNIRERFSPPVSAFLGLTIVLACVATDVAELLGGAIGFNLLFGMPLWLGALLTVLLEVFLIVSQRYHRIEAIIMGFLGIIGLCYLVEIVIVKPDWAELAPSMVVPSVNRSSIYVAMAILGAVVMPHNIFLHSNVIHSRKWGISEDEKMTLLRYEKIDTLCCHALGVGGELGDDHRGGRRLLPPPYRGRQHRAGVGDTEAFGRAACRLPVRRCPRLRGCRLVGDVVHGGGQCDHRVPGKTGRPSDTALPSFGFCYGHTVVHDHSSVHGHVSHPDLQPGRVEHPASLYPYSAADSLP